MRSQCYEVMPVAWVESPIVDIAQAPMQGDEGAPLAWLVFRPDMAVAIRDLRPGDHVVLLSWLDRRSSRRTQHASTRGSARPRLGVFSTRSPDRPNPIGLHPVRIDAIEGPRILVSDLEAVNGTPILDIKPVLVPLAER